MQYLIPNFSQTNSFIPAFQNFFANYSPFLDGFCGQITVVEPINHVESVDINLETQNQGSGTHGL